MFHSALIDMKIQLCNAHEWLTCLNDCVVEELNNEAQTLIRTVSTTSGSSRVQAVVNELQGEKIDIIKWSPDIANLAISSLSPAEVLKVVMDEDQNKIEVVVSGAAGIATARSGRHAHHVGSG